MVTALTQIVAGTKSHATDLNQYFDLLHTTYAFDTNLPHISAAPVNGSPYVAITSQGTDVGTNAPFKLVYGGAVMNARFDPTMFFGYNVQDGGGRPLAGEPQLHFAIEGDYDNGGARFVEAYLNYTSDDGGTAIRPWMVAINRVTDAVTWSFVATTSSFLLPTGEQLLFIDTGSILMAARTGVSNVFQIKAAASQGATLIWGANNNQTAFSIGTGGANDTSATFTLTGRTIMIMYSTPNGGAGAAISVGGVADNTAVGLFAVNTSPASVIALVARARASQSGSIFEAQDTNSAILSRFNKDGYFMTRKVAAPADGDLASSELSLWLDATNGAGKLMVKAKTANGTVVTGSLALA